MTLESLESWLRQSKICGFLPGCSGFASHIRPEFNAAMLGVASSRVNARSNLIHMLPVSQHIQIQDYLQFT